MRRFYIFFTNIQNPVYFRKSSNSKKLKKQQDFKNFTDSIISETSRASETSKNFDDFKYFTNIKDPRYCKDPNNSSY